MDVQGKIVWSRNTEILTATVQAAAGAFLPINYVC